jgi:SAM-dependent methyltransferase
MSDTGYYLDSTLYDQVYADYVADVAPFVELVRGAGGPALEVCCGNGRLLIPALEAGLSCDGLDYSEPMLAGLRDKLAARGLTTNVFHGDMRTFRLAQRYALIVIPFNSFLHNLTQADQLATLRTCRAHLAPGGRLVLTVFHPSASKLIEWDGVERLMKSMPVDDGTLRVYDRADDDRIEQVRVMTRRFEWLDAAGHVIREDRATFKLRYVYKPEMELLLRVAGFARSEVQATFGNYTDHSAARAAGPLREGDNLTYTAWTVTS